MNTNNNNNNTSYYPKRLVNYLQSLYTKQVHWLTPLPWKPNFKFLFDQVYMKDIRFSQEVHYDDVILFRSCTPQLIGNDFMLNLLNGLNQLDIRIATVEGRMGAGKTILIQKLLKDWIRVFNLNTRPRKYFLHCNLCENRGTDIHQLDMFTVSNLFNIPEYLYEELMWVIENNGENIVVLIDIDDINNSSHLLFKLFHKIFPTSKFLIFYRPDVSDTFKEQPQSQELFYLLRRRIDVKLHNFEINQILTMIKQTSSNSIMYQNFRDTVYENMEIRRLCTNPFLCMVIVSYYKDTKGMKFTENKLLFFRKIIVAIWKRHSKWHDNQSDSDIIRHIDSLLITFAQEAIDCYITGGGYFTEQDVIKNEHTSLLLHSGLLQEHKTKVEQSEGFLYSFFDPLLHEYTCALFYSKLVVERPDENVAISNVLFSLEWSNVCVFVAGLLGKKFGILLEEMDFEITKDDVLFILADSLYQCQCPTIAMKNTKRFELPSTLDLSSFPTSSSTFKGLQFLVEWSEEINNNNQYENRRNSLRLDYQKLALERFFYSKQDINIESDITTKTTTATTTTTTTKQEKRKKYRSCPDLNQAFTSLSISFSDISSNDKENEELSWGGHYQAHISKQSSLANLHSIGTNGNKMNQKSPTKTMFGSQQWVNNLSDALNRSESTLSLCSSLDTTLSNKKNVKIKELKIKGSALANRSFASMITFLRSNQLECLYLMDQQDNYNNYTHVISNKLVTKFIEVIVHMNEITLNSNHLGINWVVKLCEIIESDSSLKYISVAMIDLEDLTVENAIKLVKTVKRNKTFEQLELYCGAQPIVVQASLSFFVDILEKDNRLCMTFL